MGAKRRFLLVDLLGGVSLLVVAGPLLLSNSPQWWLALPVVLATVTWVGVVYTSERALLPERITDLSNRPFVLAAACVATLLPLLVVIVVVPGFATVIVAVLFGVGIGQTVYRLVYGFLRPAPELAVERLGRQRT